MKNVTASLTAYLLLRVELALIKGSHDTFFLKRNQYQTNTKILEKDMKICCFRSSMYVHYTHTCMHAFKFKWSYSICGLRNNPFPNAMVYQMKNTRCGLPPSELLVGEVSGPQDHTGCCYCSWFLPRT